MAAYIHDDKILVHYFQDSLTGATLSWYVSLERGCIRTWRYLTKAFLKQYNYNEDMAPDHSRLQSMSKREHEGFKEWRELAAQVQPLLTKKEMVTMFIDTLPSPFYDKVVGNVASSFVDLVVVGERIELGIKWGKFTQSSSSVGFAKKPNQEKKKGEANVIFPNPMSYTKLLLLMLQNNLIATVPLRLVQSLYPKSYDPNTKCDFHGGVIGHPTEKCWGLKHKVQDLSGGWLNFRECGPNVNSNPLPTHEGVSINAISHECLEEGHDEAQRGEASRRGEIKEVPADLVSLVEEGSQWRRQDLESDNSPSKLLIIQYNPTSRFRVLLIIQVPSNPTYRDNHAMPWRYNQGEVMLAGQEKANSAKEVTNIAKIGGVTRSGRVYAPEAL
ncbi:hypothetical protein CR513_06519, partial [Mucuna pruriens]